MLIRAFIAIELSSPIQQELERILNHLQQSSLRCIRWVKPDAIHLTLKFLGESSPEQISRLMDEIRHVAAATSPLELQVQGLGAFPSLKRPRVVWVGVQAPPDLFRLQKAIEDAADRAGYPREDRPFSPHLTLGRVRREASPGELALLSETITRQPVNLLGSMSVKQFVLFRSDLRPAGPIYTPLAHFPLNG